MIFYILAIIFLGFSILVFTYDFLKSNLVNVVSAGLAFVATGLLFEVLQFMKDRGGFN